MTGPHDYSRIPKDYPLCRICGKAVTLFDEAAVSTQDFPLCNYCRTHAQIGPEQYTDFVMKGNSYHFTKIDTITLLDNPDLGFRGRLNKMTSLGARPYTIEIWHPKKELRAYHDYKIKGIRIRNWPREIKANLFDVSDIPLLSTLPKIIRAKVVFLWNLPISSLKDVFIEAGYVHCKGLKGLKEIPANAIIYNRIVYEDCPNISSIPENINYNIEVDDEVINRIPKTKLPLYMNVCLDKSKETLLNRIKENE